MRTSSETIVRQAGTAWILSNSKAVNAGIADKYINDPENPLINLDLKYALA